MTPHKSEFPILKNHSKGKFKKNNFAWNLILSRFPEGWSFGQILPEGALFCLTAVHRRSQSGWATHRELFSGGWTGQRPAQCSGVLQLECCDRFGITMDPYGGFVPLRRLCTALGLPMEALLRWKAPLSQPPSRPTRNHDSDDFWRPFSKKNDQRKILR